jgi:hypothetical protein
LRRGFPHDWGKNKVEQSVDGTDVLPKAMFNLEHPNNIFFCGGRISSAAESRTFALPEACAEV